jgi:hypothetical protein
MYYTYLMIIAQWYRCFLDITYSMSFFLFTGYKQRRSQPSEVPLGSDSWSLTHDLFWGVSTNG